MDDGPNEKNFDLQIANKAFFRRGNWIFSFARGYWLKERNPIFVVTSRLTIRTSQLRKGNVFLHILMFHVNSLDHVHSNCASISTSIFPVLVAATQAFEDIF